MVELVGGGSVINVAFPVKFYILNHHVFDRPGVAGAGLKTELGLSKYLFIYYW